MRISSLSVLRDEATGSWWNALRSRSSNIPKSSLLAETIVSISLSAISPPMLPLSRRWTSSFAFVICVGIFR